jgi:hypothetical protein
VELLKKKDSKYYWYDFTVAGRRYQGSTKETNEKRAGASSISRYPGLDDAESTSCAGVA